MSLPRDIPARELHPEDGGDGHQDPGGDGAVTGEENLAGGVDTREEGFSDTRDAIPHAGWTT